MSRKRKSSTSVQKTGDGFIGRLFAQTKLPAHVTEEQDWYLDTPDVRLTRVFTIVLILHVVAVGGILAFKMVEKASDAAPLAIVDNTGSDESTGDAGTAGDAAAVGTEEAVQDATPAEEPPVESLLVDHPSANEYQEYRVGSGESLISIAKKLNVSASEIREINNLDSGGNLTVGRWIQVPKGRPEAAPSSAVAAADTSKPATPASQPEPKPEPAVSKPAPKPAVVVEKTPQPKPAPAPKPGSNTLAAYEVKKGDTLFGIARRFGINYKDLMAANQIDRPESLQAGQTLQVPGN